MLFLFVTAANAQNFTNLAGEYRIIGTLGGDQVNSAVAFNDVGGWVVWQDNVTDGSGMGISARRLNSTLSGDFSVFRVNQNGLGEQEFPQVTMLKNGGAAFVWQGGRTGFQDIFARFVAADGTFLSPEFLVNSYTNQYQIRPVITSLVNSNVVVAWTSMAQDGSGLGVYARLLSPTGQISGNEFRVNQSANHNQRGVSVAGLSDGNFIVVWVSESPRAATENDPRQVNATVWGRIFTPAGTAVGNEFLVSTANVVCDRPSVASFAAGGFVATWSKYDIGNRTNGWDVFAATFDNSGNLVAGPAQLNIETFGDQHTSRVAASGTNYVAVWTSLGQDGSYEGVYGRSMTSSGTPRSGEIRVNTTTGGKQVEPSVAASANGNYLVVWSSYVSGGPSFDLYAQRFSDQSGTQVFPPAAPYISVLSSGSVNVTWPDLAGYSVAFYELHVSGSPTPIVVSGNQITVTNLTPSTTYSFRLLYQLADGRRSSLSVAADATTWSPDNSGDGLPDDWQAIYWGANPANWPSPNQDSDGDGASNLLEFLAGTDPSDSTSVLRTRLHKTPQGSVFSWQTVPGFIYQVQSAAELGGWQNLGSPRFAHGIMDAINLGSAGAKGFYRVIRIR